MATKFLEPGGDADFAVTTTNGFWGSITTAPAVATDFVNRTHQRSIKYRAGNADIVLTPTAVLADAGTRYSFYLYLVALPSSTASICGDNNSVHSLRLTSGGVLQAFNSTPAQIGTNGATLSTGQWYRISVAYTITSTVINRFEIFVNGVSSISITNATLNATSTSTFRMGNMLGNATLDMRSSDLYIDDSNSLTDPGNIIVTAKRPNANGTANNFVTQIGSGGSGYGTGHSPQVNERALSTTNGWSVVAVGVTTEEYNIESQSTGDMDMTNGRIIDYMGWVSAKTLNAETGSIVVNGVTSNISLTTTITLFRKIAGSTTYPAATGTDIGMVTSALATTVSLYECGIVFAYIPPLDVSVNEAITVTESVTMDLGQLGDISVNDTVTLTESVTVEEVYGISVNDAITVTESVNLEQVHGVVVNDAITVTESVTLEEVHGIIVNDAITVTESVTRDFLVEISAFETITVSESVTVTNTLLGDLSVSETITVSESISTDLQLDVSAFDAITLTEDVGTDLQLDISAFDTVTLSESVAMDQVLGLSVFDAITVSESVEVIVIDLRKGLILMRSRQQNMPLALDDKTSIGMRSRQQSYPLGMDDAEVL